MAMHHYRRMAASSALMVGLWAAGAEIAAAEPPQLPHTGAPAGAPAGARETEAILTLEQAVDAALAENPRLRAMHATWQAAQQRPLQARTLPDPTFRYGGMDATGNYGFPDTEESRFELEQSFPWFGKLGLRGKAAEKEAEAQGFDYQTTAREVILLVKEAYFDRYGVQHAISITRAEQDVLKRMQALAETRYATGEATQQDVLKAQAEVSVLKAQLLDLEEQETSLTARLNELLNRRADSPLGLAVTRPAGGPETTLERLFAAAESARPEIKSAQARVERDRYQRDLARRDFFPDYRLGIEYRRLRSSDDMVMFNVGIDLPIWRPKYRAALREAESLIESDEAARQAAERQTSFDVREAHFKLATARRTVELYAGALIPQAQARLQASEAGYRSGKVGFLDLLESQRFLLNARVMHAVAEGNLGVQLARLERAIGTDLETTAANDAAPR